MRKIVTVLFVFSIFISFLCVSTKALAESECDGFYVDMKTIPLLSKETSKTCETSGAELYSYVMRLGKNYNLVTGSSIESGNDMEITVTAEIKSRYFGQDKYEFATNSGYSWARCTAQDAGSYTYKGARATLTCDMCDKEHKFYDGVLL